ncbi:MAG TPA: M23 family metallopeptidase, partial [Myxococcota bacterium]|nr:M23 family metallopeptidase [Myxococcota bacterium]
MILWLAWAAAQDYRFPSTDAQRELFYPTAYRDEGGVDWACRDLFYGGHRGSDFGAGGFAGMDEGRTVVAAAEGVVIAAHDGEDDRCTSGACGDEVYGNHVEVRHPDGRTTLYGHLARGSLVVAEGDHVGCGAPVGRMGSSGWSTGPHLHFGLRDLDDAYVDPFAGPCSPDANAWVEPGGWGEVPAATCAPEVAACVP